MSTALSEVWRGAGRAVPIEYRADRRSRLSLRADAAQGVIRVSHHPRAGARTVADFLAAHDGWIAARVARWPAARPFEAGATVPVEGADHVIDWDAARPRRVAREAGRLVAGGPLDGLAGRIERFLRAEALRLLDSETRALAMRVGKPLTRVAVRDTSSRWGSCSNAGGINYSWRLIFAPPEVRRSVVAHEVAHLVHLNHGRDFWRLAGDLYDGDMAAARRWLKAHGPSLHWVGRS